MPGMDGFISFNGTLNGSVAGGSGGEVKDVKTNASGSYESVVDESGDAYIDLSPYAKESEVSEVSEDIETLTAQVAAKQKIINYSTEEQNTGIKWVDGKPLYQKTVIIDNITTLSASYSLGISNFDDIVDIRTVWKRGRLNRWSTLDTVREATYSQYATYWQISNDGAISLEFTNFPLSDIQISYVYVTIIYTKTTD